VPTAGRVSLADVVLAIQAQGQHTDALPTNPTHASTSCIVSAQEKPCHHDEAPIPRVNQGF
jgi:hypothetical protein